MPQNVNELEDALRHLEGPKESADLESALALLEADDAVQDAKRQAFETLGEAVGALGTGFNRGMATVIGLPGEAANLALNLAGFDARVPAITEARAFLDRSPFTTTQGSDRTAATRTLGVAGELIGAGVLMGGAGSLSTRGLAASLGAAGAISGVREQGIDNPATELLAGFAGGMAGTVAPTAGRLSAKLAKAGGVKTLDALRVTERGQTTAARKLLKKQAADPERAVRNIESAQVHGLTPEITAAQASNDPGLLALERSVRRTNAAIEGRFLDNQTRINDRATADALNQFPQGAEVSTAQAAIGQARKTAVDALDRRVLNARVIARQKLDALGPKLDRETAAVVVRSELESALRDARAAEKLKWGAVPGDKMVVTKPIRDTLLEIESSLSKADRSRMNEVLPDNIRKLVKNDFGALEPVDEVLSLRHVLLDELRVDRAGKAPSRKLVANLNKLQDAALLSLHQQTGRRLSQDAQRSIDDALNYSRSLNDRFTRGPIGQVLQFERAGGSSVPKAETLEALIKPGTSGATAGDAFVAAMAEPERRLLARQLADPERAGFAMRQGIIDSFVEQVTDGAGKVSALAQREFLKKHDSLLRRFPEMHNELKDATKAQEIAGRVLSTSTRLQANLANKATSRAALFLSVAPDKAMKRLLAAPNPRKVADELLRQVRRDPTGMALQGLRRGLVREWLGAAETGTLDAAGHRILSPSRMMEFAGEHNAVINAVLDGGQRKRLQDIIDQLKTFARSEAKSSVSGAVQFDSENLLTESIARVIGVRVGSKVGHPLSTATIFSKVTTRISRLLGAGKVRAIIEEALFNPELMKTLLKKPSTPLQLEQEIIPAFERHLLVARIATEVGTDEPK